MTADPTAPRPARPSSRFPYVVAALGGVLLSASGLWAMLAPESFFDTVATFEPYNQHLIQDLGAFQIGLGAVLLLSVAPAPSDALAVALIGVGVGMAAHTVSHVVGHDLGGNPAVDIPSQALLTALLLAAGVVRARHQPSASRRATTPPT